MADLPINFGVQSSPGREFADTGPRHFNGYAEPHADAKVPAPIHAFDGFDLFATLTNGGRLRGAVVVGPYAYVISGNGMFKVDEAGSWTLIGGIPGSGFCAIDRNQATPTQITVATESTGFVIENDVITQVTDPDLLPPVSVATVNHSSVWVAATGEIMWSESDDAGNIAAGSVVSAEADPDGLVRGIEFKGDLWALGRKSVEILRDTGATVDRFQRMPGGVLRRGCMSAASVQNIAEFIVWLGDDGHVYRASGQGFEQLSHDGVQRAVTSVTDKATITSSSFTSRGVPFYVLSSDDWTWQVSLKTGKWFERTSFRSKRWKAEGAFDFHGRTILGDVSDGKLYVLNEATRAENSVKNTLLLRSGVVDVYPHLLTIDALDVDFQTGVGLNSTDPHTNDPKVGLRISKDSGATWSNQRVAKLGPIGARDTRVRFNSLGTVPETGMVFELEISAPTVRTFVKAVARGSRAA